MNDKRKDALAVLGRLRDAGFEGYFVGGCVRDQLMGRLPQDYDIATNAHPGQVLELFPGALPVGAKFGVVLVSKESGDVEVATYRSDGRYDDGRHPVEVRFASTAEEDVRRRDFTINGLLFDPIEERVLDHVGGEADLRARRVRTIGDPGQRFSEDYLRMLRAVRFAARFNFTIHPPALAAIRELAPRLREVSAERTRDEILKILTEGSPRRGFELLDECGLLAEVLPEVKALQGVEQPPQFHPEGDVWIHTLMMLDGLRQPSETLALGVLLHDVGKPPTFSFRDRIRFDGHPEVGAKMAKEISGRLRLSSKQTERVVELVRHHLRFKDFPKMRRSTQLRFLRMEGFDEHLELHRLDCLSSHRDLTHYELARRMLQEIPAEEIRPRPLVDGDDLIAAGHKPGPRFKEILQAVEDAQLDGIISSREDALRLVEERFPL
ncbi:MAG: CCA tRNA nucleotidyltransferase [Terriglobia bacterium]